ncbi:hypothetical protein GCWU000246_01710 [Jonquetella anthropi E3_33 E1]|nr:hypothetical protein GCWU000246_01710 [Jonquetella anthropi E3_33 E1]
MFSRLLERCPDLAVTKMSIFAIARKWTSRVKVPYLLSKQS